MRAEPQGHFLNRWASWAVLLTVAFAVVMTVYIEFIRSSPYDPVTFPLREPIASTVPGVAGPAIHIGQRVVMSELECSRETAAIPVRVTLSYRQIKPPGPDVPFVDSITRSTSFTLDLPGGCTNVSLPLPTTILTAPTMAEYRRGFAQVVWQLVGTLKPIHAHAATRTFQSDNFTVVP